MSGIPRVRTHEMITRSMARGAAGRQASTDTQPQAHHSNSSGSDSRYFKLCERAEKNAQYQQTRTALFESIREKPAWTSFDGRDFKARFPF